MSVAELNRSMSNLNLSEQGKKEPCSCAQYPNDSTLQITFHETVFRDEPFKERSLRVSIAKEPPSRAPRPGFNRPFDRQFKCNS